ncbi:caspase family protein [Mesorhizobium sp. M0816]|uniref:caspase family protein n=1 Tax=Mesorhizobium sp. M0816 TaxID=2957006 RepID=UPI00333D421E
MRLANILLALAVALLFVGQASAAKRAFIVGVDNYLDPDLSLFGKPVNDARSIAKVLNEDGFAAVQLETDLTLSDLSEQFDLFLATVQRGDTVVFYFSGHGLELDGDNWLAATDANRVNSDIGKTQLRAEVAAHALSLRQIMADLEEKGAETQILIIDACREELKEVGKAGIAASGLNALVTDPPKQTFVLYAAAARQEALPCLSQTRDCSDDPDPNSLFTRKLLPLMAKPGLTINEIAESVKSEVEKAAASIGRQQRPTTFNELSSLLPPVVLREDDKSVSPLLPPPPEELIPLLPEELIPLLPEELIPLPADVIYFKKATESGLIETLLRTEGVQFETNIDTGDGEATTEVICTPDANFELVRKVALTLHDGGVKIYNVAMPADSSLSNIIYIQSESYVNKRPMTREEISSLSGCAARSAADDVLVGHDFWAAGDDYCQNLTSAIELTSGEIRLKEDGKYLDYRNFTGTPKLSIETINFDRETRAVCRARREDKRIVAYCSVNRSKVSDFLKAYDQIRADVKSCLLGKGWREFSTTKRYVDQDIDRRLSYGFFIGDRDFWAYGNKDSDGRYGVGLQWTLRLTPPGG